MLIEKDRSNQPIAPPLVLAHKSGEKIGVLLPDPSTLTIKIFLEDSYILSSEMSCNINKYINTFTNTLWDEIKNFKLLYIPIDIPNFKPKGIWYEIEVTIDDYDNTVKHITGTMAQHAELSQVNNYEVEIRTENDIDRDDYIDTIFYNPDEPKASIVHRVLNDKAKHYSIYHVDDSLKNIKRTFEFNGESVLSNLHSIAEEIDCIIIFGESEQADNNMHRTVSFYDAKDYCPECGKRGDFSNGCTTPNCTHSQKIIPRYGKDSGIYINKENLGENINLSVNTDEIKNCFRLSAGDDDMLTAIIDCNPAGSRYIWHFTDEMKENMSDALRQRLDIYQAQSDDVRYNYLLSNLTESRITNYNAIVDKYQSYSKEELNKINRNDKGYSALIGAYYGALYLEGFLQTMMMPYSPEVVDTTAEEQINLYTLTTLGVRNLVAISNTFAANEVRDSVKIYIDTSRYKVDTTTTNYDKTTNTWTGTIIVTSLTDEEDTATIQKTLTFTDQQSDYLKNQIDQLLKKRETGLYGITDLVKADNVTFSTEIKKYCLDSLSIISDVLTAVVSIMDNAEITPSTSPDVYNEIYVPYQSKIPIINQEMTDRENDINRVGYVIEKIQNYKQQMKESLDIETFLGETLWNELLAIRREDEQEDNNFISDGLTDLEIIANAQEFYDTAIEKITKQAESQLTASCTLKDLLLICPETYDDKIKLFDIGNWIRIDIDEKIYKLRLISYQFNYGDLTRIQVEFSDCKPSNNIISQFRIAKNQAKNNQKGIEDISKQVDQNIEDINAVLQPFYIQESLVLPVTSIVTETGETLDEYLKNEHIDNVVEIEEAKKVAVNYMSQDDSGIMIAPLLSDYKYLPSEVPLDVVNTFIDNESFNVRLGRTPIARFSANELWLGNNQNFSVTADGYLTATNVDISGTIFANTFSTTNGEITYDGTNLNIDASALTIQGTSVATTDDLNGQIGKYLRYESTYGLMIADMVNGIQTISDVTSYNVLLDSTSLKIRNGTSVLAEYGSSIKLYQPGTSTVAVEINPAFAKFTGSVIATGGTIGGFNITSTANADTTNNNGHCFANSLYAHTADSGYEYESGLTGETVAGNIAFYVKRMTSGDSWSNANYVYYVTNLGKLYAENAEIKGAITATSLATGNKTSSATGATGLFIDSNGNLFAGANNQIIIRGSNGTLNIGNGALQYNGSKLTISGDVTAENFIANGSYAMIDGSYIAGTYVSIGDNIVLTNRTSNGITPMSGYIALRETGMSASRTTYYKINEINFGGIGTITASGTSTSFSATKFGFTNDINTGLSFPTNGTYSPYAIRLYNGTLFFGTNMDPDAASTGIDRNPAPTTYIRGETVRITGTISNAGGVFLGTTANSNVYLVNTSTAVTSDEQIKDVYEINNKYIDFFNNINPIGYRYKNNGHRTHIGFGARAIKKALEDANLTTEDFAGIVINDNVNLGDESNPEYYNELYFLRYEEFIALNTMMIQRLQKEIQSLQNEIKSLKNAFLY